LFPSEEGALEFLENHDLEEARVELLMQFGRTLEAAEVHAKNGNMLKAVEILTASAHRVSHVRPTIEYLLTGLRRDLTLGAPPIFNSTASKLLALADQLERSAMTKQEVDEVFVSYSSPIDGSYTQAPPARDVQGDPGCRPYKPSHVRQVIHRDGELPCRFVVPGSRLFDTSQAAQSSTFRGSDITLPLP